MGDKFNNFIDKSNLSPGASQSLSQPTHFLSIGHHLHHLIPAVILDQIEKKYDVKSSLSNMMYGLTRKC